MRVCPTCSHESDDGAVFCADCGGFLDWESSADPLVADRPGASRFAPSAPPPPPRAPAPTSESTVAPEPADSVHAADAPEVDVDVGEPPRPAAVPDAPAPASPVPPPRTAEAARLPQSPPSRLLVPPAPSGSVVPPAPPPPSSPAVPPAPPRPSSPAVPPAPALSSAPAPGRSGRAPPRAPVTRAPPSGVATCPPTESAGPDRPDPAADAKRAERLRRLVAPSGIVPAAESAAPAREASPPQSPPAGRAERASRPSPRPAPAPTPRVAGSAPATGSFASIIQVAERAGRTDLSASLREHRESIRRIGVTHRRRRRVQEGQVDPRQRTRQRRGLPGRSGVRVDRADHASSHGDEFDGHLTFARRSHRTPRRSTWTQLAELASEAGNEGNHLGLARVDITAPPPPSSPPALQPRRHARRRRAGLGVGALNLASLDAADGVVFVTDCTQELTAPELTFLVAARRPVPGDGLRDDQARHAAPRRRRSSPEPCPPRRPRAGRRRAPRRLVGAPPRRARPG